MGALKRMNIFCPLRNNALELNKLRILSQLAEEETATTDWCKQWAHDWFSTKFSQRSVQKRFNFMVVIWSDWKKPLRILTLVILERTDLFIFLLYYFLNTIKCCSKDTGAWNAEWRIKVNFFSQILLAQMECVQTFCL